MQTADSDEPDPLEDALGDFARATHRELDGWPGTGASAPKDRGELVERTDSISFILMAPGYLLRDFRVTAYRGVLRVLAPDFDVARPLACRVDPREVATDYRNGILSVRIPKRP